MSTKAGTTPDKAAVNPEDQSGSVPPAANPATGPATTNEKDVGGKRVFLALLIIIPVAVFISLGVLTLVVWNNPDTSVVTTVTTSSDGKVITTTTTYITPTLVYGAADPGLGKVKGFFIGPLIFLMASIIETSLLLIYGAFY